MIERRSAWLPLLLAGLLSVGTAIAQEQRAEVSLGSSAKAAPWTGEQVTLDLDLKTPALSFAEVHFNLPEVPGALVLRTDSTTVKLSEQRAGETWQVLRYPITLFPQQAGTVAVPSFEVRFRTQNGFGSESVAHRLETEPLTVEVRQPPGLAPGQVVVTTPQLELSADWDLPDDPVQTGDAVTLTVERRAVGLSAMLLPPLPIARAEGLAVYPSDPEIDDQTNRGSLTGVRIDRVTWIIEQAGAYTLPDVLFRSWDPSRQELQTQRVEGVGFSAVALPQQAPGATPELRDAARDRASRDWRPLFLAALLAGLLGFLGWRFRRNIATVLAALRVRILPPARALLDTLNPGASS